MAATNPIGDTVKAAAREWFVKTVLETPTPQTRAEFAHWQAMDPAHAAAYARCLDIWEDSARLTDLAPLAGETETGVGIGTDRPRIGRPRSLMREPLARLAAAAAVVAVGLLAWRYAGLPRAEHFSTGIAQIREIGLTDGSHVTLGARSGLEVSFDRRSRRVTLSAGEAFFDVARDDTTPFIVTIGHQQVRVLGTSFDVRRVNDTVHVSVLTGVVQLDAGDPASQESAARKVRAGQELDAALSSSATGPVRPLGASNPTAWRQGRLEYVDTTLAEVIADANRYSTRQYLIPSSEVAQQRVSVSYETASVDHMVARLAQTLSLKLAPQSGQEVRLEPSAAPGAGAGAGADEGSPTGR